MNPAVTIALDGNEVADFRWRERLLARYRLPSATTPANQSPRPYLHPVYTLRGDVVTDFSPADHLWHHGVSWAIPYVNGINFWGGPSFDPQTKSYLWYSNHGRQRHERWLDINGALRHEVSWVAPDESVMITEFRSIRGEIDNEDSWTLVFESTFANRTPVDLSLKSPVCLGREDGGYFGLFWRGAPSWGNGKIDPLCGSMMGLRAPHLSYTKVTDGLQVAKLRFADHPSNPRFPTRWFERHADQAIITASLAYSEPWVIGPNQLLRLTYSITLEDLNA